MKLLSKELVSLDYTKELQRDLNKATLCRFLVAYVSLTGLNAINRPVLIKPLRDPRSFGIASLSCSCGYEPLIKLQNELGASTDVRLKYFMDPMVKDPDEPNNLSLFHSKLVYLWLEREAKSVVYIGSHNWTRRALGPGGPRNVEASVRFELDFSPDDLDGTGTSVAAHVNRHLLQAWDMPVCLPATPANEPLFQEWYERGCRRAESAPLEDTTIVLTVRKTTGASVAPDQWLNLQGHGIYLQSLEEDEGKLVWDSDNRLLILVWDSEADLRAARQPIILKCRITTNKAGLDSQMRGTNQSVAPVAGFEAVIFDEMRLAGLQNSTRVARPPVRIWSGRDVQVYDFEFPASSADSSQVDGVARPKYQFHLEVERVILPADDGGTSAATLLWERETFAVAARKDSARFEEKPGYYVEPQLEAEILKCLTSVLFINPKEARVLPCSQMDHAKLGKRVSEHPLHDTYISPESKRSRAEFYEKSGSGALVAEIDEPVDKRKAPALFRDSSDPVPRVQRVFTTPIADLLELWKDTAQRWRSQRGGHVKP
jgi:hypothetical protein